METFKRSDNSTQHVRKKQQRRRCLRTIQTQSRCLMNIFRRYLFWPKASRMKTVCRSCFASAAGKNRWAASSKNSDCLSLSFRTTSRNSSALCWPGSNAAALLSITNSRISVEDSTRGHRNFTSALPTMKIASTCCPRLRFPSAPATPKSFWPTTTQKITAARRLIGKPFQKLLVSSRVVLSRHWIQSCFRFHTKRHYMLWVLASSGYPLYLPYILIWSNLLKMRRKR